MNIFKYIRNKTNKFYCVLNTKLIMDNFKIVHNYQNNDSVLNQCCVLAKFNSVETFFSFPYNIYHIEEKVIYFNKFIRYEPVKIKEVLKTNKCKNKIAYFLDLNSCKSFIFKLMYLRKQCFNNYSINFVLNKL